MGVNKKIKNQSLTSIELPGYAGRCSAKTRSGEPCKSFPVRGKKRCRMHGGAFGTGAPKGNKNALKHGFFTRESLKDRRRIRHAFKYWDELNKIWDGEGEDIDEDTLLEMLEAAEKI